MLIYIIVINSLNAAITIISKMLFYIESSTHYKHTNNVICLIFYNSCIVSIDDPSLSESLYPMIFSSLYSKI